MPRASSKGVPGTFGAVWTFGKQKAKEKISGFDKINL